MINDTREKILEFLKQEVKNGRSPSMEEIAKAVGLSSPSSVTIHLKRLENEGRIERSRRQRDIRVIERPDMLVRLSIWYCCQNPVTKEHLRVLGFPLAED